MKVDYGKILMDIIIEAIEVEDSGNIKRNTRKDGQLVIKTYLPNLTFWSSSVRRWVHYYSIISISSSYLSLNKFNNIIKNLKFNISPTGFKHTGLFPEQAANWDWAMDKIENAKRPIKVLNLFAYTGGATVACAAAGAEG